MTGVRSSCDTSATNRRFWCCARSSRRIVSDERVGHPVEPVGPRPELVVRCHRHPRKQVATFDPFCGPARLLDRGEDAARQRSGGDQGDEDEHRGAGEHHDAKLLDRLRDLRDVPNEVDGQVAARGEPADDQRGGATDVDPRIRKLASSDARRNIGRQSLEEVRRACRWT